MNNFDYETIPAGYYDQVYQQGAGVQSKWHHLNLFKRNRLKHELEASGFSTVRVRAYQFFAPFMAALTWSLADSCYQIDKGCLSSRMGFLLFAEAIK
jgi:hypothetical protein